MLATQLNMDMRQFNRLHIVHNAFLTALPVEGGGEMQDWNVQHRNLWGWKMQPGHFIPRFPALYLPPFDHFWSSIFRSCIFSHSTCRPTDISSQATTLRLVRNVHITALLLRIMHIGSTVNADIIDIYFWIYVHCTE